MSTCSLVSAVPPGASSVNSKATVRGGQPLSLRLDPLLVVAGQQLALVQLRRLREPLHALALTARVLGSSEDRFEGGNIRGEGSRVELHAAPGRGDHRAGGDAGRF